MKNLTTVTLNPSAGLCSLWSYMKPVVYIYANHITMITLTCRRMHVCTSAEIFPDTSDSEKNLKRLCALRLPLSLFVIMHKMQPLRSVVILITLFFCEIYVTPRNIIQHIRSINVFAGLKLISPHWSWWPSVHHLDFMLTPFLLLLVRLW